MLTNPFADAKDTHNNITIVRSTCPSMESGYSLFIRPSEYSNIATAMSLWTTIHVWGRWTDAHTNTHTHTPGK